MIRRIDDLGRVVIPKEIRQEMKIREGDPLEIKITNGVITISKTQMDCVYCNTEINDVYDRNNPYLCNVCIAKLKSS